jgi:tetratricopeptide (TPR) repeat protein
MSARILSSAVLVAFAAVAAAEAHPGLHHDIARASEAIEKDPTRAELYVERAYLERLDEEFDLALADLDMARTKAPTDLRVAAERGMTLSAMERYAEAEQELTRFLSAGSGTAPAFAERANVREHLGRKSAAVADYTSAIAIRPDVEFYMARGALQESLHDLTGAAVGYRDGIARLGDAVNFDLALIRVETSRKRYDAALALIDAQLARSAVKTDWYLRRADVLEAAHRSGEARQNRERALAEADRALEQNTNGIRLYSRAKVQLALGRYDAAKRDLAQVLEKAPGFAEAREMLAMLDTADNHKGMKP